MRTRERERSNAVAVAASVTENFLMRPSRGMRGETKRKNSGRKREREVVQNEMKARG